MTKGGSTLKTIIVLVILVLVGVLGVLGVNTIKTYTSGASSNGEPKSVLAKPSANSATISWTSDVKAQSVVEYGTSPASLLLRAAETDSIVDHSVQISPLKQNTSYYFRIRVGDQVYDNGGIPYSFKTKVDETATPTIVTMPTVALVPTAASTCMRNIDYNKDGTTNSLDFIYCMQHPLGGTIVPTGTTSTCSREIDYNADGVINSLDFIKCLQSKK